MKNKKNLAFIIILIVAMVGASVVLIINKKQTEKKQMEQERSEYISRLHYLGITLGYNYVDIKDVDLYQSEVIARTHGYIHYNECELTAEELAQAILDGTIDRETYKAFQKFIDDGNVPAERGGNGYWAYKDALRKHMDMDALNEIFSEKYGVLLNGGPTDLPPEVLLYVIELYEANS